MKSAAATEEFKVELTPEQLRGMRSYLRLKISDIPSALPTLPISEHAENHRVMPPGTPRPGPLDLSYTPWLIEIADNMSPDSPIQHQAIMKGAQGGFTMILESIICYYIGYAPSDILFTSATDALLERWASRRLEPALDSYDLRRHIYAQYASPNSRRLGDKTYSKEYFGCRLDMASAQAASSLRSTDKRILLRDEIDGAPAQLRTGEGSYLAVSYARTNAWGDRRKVTDISTPTTFEDSAIYQQYLKGDQRKLMVPCPKCNKKQELKFENLEPVKEGAEIIEAHYICEHCKHKIRNSDKALMFKKAEWKPTVISRSKYYRSYHWSSLYAPVGMITWREIYALYEEAKEDPDGMRSFTNLYLGLPYRESGERPKFEKAVGLRSAYRSGTIPDGVLFLTGSIDVQEGAERRPDKPPRLELEICGHGDKYRRWSIEYKVFPGQIDDPYDGAWQMLNDWAVETGLVYKRGDGRILQVGIIFVDSGSGEHQDTVYQFSEGWSNLYPSKGFQDLIQRKNEKGDVMTKDNFLRYRAKKVSETITLYEIATNYYRNHLYKTIQRTIGILGEPGADKISGYCGFPADYPDDYFKQLTAPERRRDGTFDKRGRDAEAHDNQVYNLCAADVWIDAYVKERQQEIKAAGANPLKITNFNRKFALLEMKFNLGDCDEQEVETYRRTIADLAR